MSISKQFYVSSSAIHGLGLFTRRAVQQDEMLCEVFSPTGLIEAVGGLGEEPTIPYAGLAETAYGAFVNHAVGGTATLVRREDYSVWLSAKSNLPAGTELTCDYSDLIGLFPAEEVEILEATGYDPGTQAITRPAPAPYVPPQYWRNRPAPGSTPEIPGGGDTPVTGFFVTFLSLSIHEEEQAIISWIVSDEEGVSTYRLQKSDSAVGVFSPVGEEVAANGTGSYSEMDITYAGGSYYRVVARAQILGLSDIISDVEYLML